MNISPKMSYGVLECDSVTELRAYDFVTKNRGVICAGHYIYIHIYTHTCAYIYIYIRFHIHTHTYTCVYIYIYMKPIL